MNYNHQPATDIFTYLQLTTLRVGCARSFLLVSEVGNSVGVASLREMLLSYVDWRVTILGKCNLIGISFCIVSLLTVSSDSSVGIALGYRLDDRGSRVRFPAGAGNFFSSLLRPE
jgi:hypothetical protein